MTFWILDDSFRFWIGGTRIGYALRSKYSHASSSPIQNPKAAPRTKMPADQNGAGPIALAVTFVLCGAVAEAQQQAKIAKIGWLGAGSLPVRPPAARAIRRMLRELGYVEGKNIAFEFREADNKLDRLPALADELVRLKVDVFITRAPRAALAAKNATRTIPIVFYRRS